MNIGQQVGIEKLFSKINKTLQKNPNETISEADLNKLRAYVIKSQRPLQAVKLLEKEKEEREADYNFVKQKEEIIEKAQQLEQEKSKFKKDQMEMIRQVKDSMGTIIQNANKRKLEENKKQREEQEIKSKEAKIKELTEELHRKKQEHEAKKRQLEKFKIYSDFLEEVVNADGDNKEFEDIETLKNRFYILRKENDNLTKKQNDINKQIEEIKQDGKKKMDKLQNELYMMQRKMQEYQNNQLEQEFGFEVSTNNETTKLHGQVITAVNNIYEMCINQMHKKAVNTNNRFKSTSENDELLMKALSGEIPKDKATEGVTLLSIFNKKLETIGETIEDLKEVAKLVPEYSRDHIIAEEAAGTAKPDTFKALATKVIKDA
jgi:hypothetical protein